MQSFWNFEYCSYLAAKIDVMMTVPVLSETKGNQYWQYIFLNRHKRLSFVFQDESPTAHRGCHCSDDLLPRVASSPKAAKRGRSLPSPWILPLNWPQYDYPLLYYHWACNSSNHVLHKFPSLRGRVRHQPFAKPPWWHEWLQGYKWQSSRRWAWISQRQCGRRARSQWVV